MSESQVAGQTGAKKVVNLDVVRILNLGCNLLHHAFITAKEIESKGLLKELKSGKAVKVGALTLTPKVRDEAAGAENAGAALPSPMEMPLRLALDYSEFVGPFSFPAFRQALAAMLQQLGKTLQAKADLNVLTNPDNNSMLIHQPGVIQVNGQYNVLVLAIVPGGPKEIVLKLMFVDPNQYEKLRKADA